MQVVFAASTCYFITQDRTAFTSHSVEIESLSDYALDMRDHLF